MRKDPKLNFTIKARKVWKLLNYLPVVSYPCPSFHYISKFKANQTIFVEKLGHFKNEFGEAHDIFSKSKTVENFIPRQSRPTKSLQYIIEKSISTLRWFTVNLNQWVSLGFSKNSRNFSQCSTIKNKSEAPYWLKFGEFSLNLRDFYWFKFRVFPCQLAGSRSLRTPTHKVWVCSPTSEIPGNYIISTKEIWYIMKMIHYTLGKKTVRIT